MGCCQFSVGQGTFPNVDFHKKITTKSGLEDRVVSHVNRNQNGVYLFVTEKIQYYTGQKFINKSKTIPPLLLTTDQYVLSDIYDVYDWNANLIFPNSFQGTIVQSFHQNGKLNVLEKNEDQYAIHQWDEDRWNIVHDFKAIEDLKAAIVFNDRTIFVNAKGELKDLDRAKILFTRDNLEPIDNPNNTIIKKVRDHCYFSFEGYKGIFRIDAQDSIYIIDDKNVLHDVYVDEVGQTLLLGRDRRRIINNVYLVDKNGTINNWNALLRYSDIISNVYSENFKESIILATFNGLEMIRFVDPKPYISKIFGGPKDNRGFGRVVTSITQGDAQNLLNFSEAGAGMYGTMSAYDELQLGNRKQAIRFSHYDNLSKEFLIGLDNYGGRRGEIYTFDPLSKKFQHKAEVGPIFCSFKTDNNSFYLGGVNGYFAKWTEDKLVTYSQYKILKNQAIRSLYIGDVKLIGTEKGLYLNKGSHETPELFKLHSDEIYKSVRVIKKYGSHYYIGTYGSGLFVLDSDLQIINHINKECCALNGYVYSVEQDSVHNLWLGTNNGLFILDKDGNVNDRLSTKDGLSAIEFNTQASLLADDGNLYFGTINGMTVIDPNKYVQQEIGDYFVNEILAYKNKDILYQGPNRKFFQFNTKLDSIEIVAVQRGLQDYYPKYASRNMFDYSGRANYNIDKNTITLYRPSYGEHVLYLNGKDRNPITVLVKRDYLALGKRILGFVLALALLGYLFYKFLERRSKRKLEESELRIQLAQIKLEALRSQLNPHFIFNSLGAIGYYIQTKESRIANNYLTKFAKLIRAFLESSKNEFISVVEEIQLITYYLELEKMRFVDAFDYEILCDEEVDALHETLPTMMIQPFIENSIIHGIVHRKGKDGKINVHFSKEGESLVCTIDDNGVGREMAKELKKKSLKKHKSRAMEIITDRIKYSEMSNEVSLSVDIKDKYENEKPTGTSVVITITNKH